MLPKPGSTLEIQVLLDFVDVLIPALLKLDVQDANNYLVENVTNHLWNRTNSNKDPLRF